VESPEIDRIDQAILGELLRNGRVSWQELARRVSLSPSATADRVRRLEQQGIVTGYTALLDQGRLGRTLEVVIDVRVDHERTDEVIAAALGHEGITDVAHVTGSFDLLIRGTVTDPADLDRYLERLRTAGATETQTRLILRHYRSN
jgi:Lrp/AsnC family transcriptional regulator, leucine-responsive regulatory protein